MKVRFTWEEISKQKTIVTDDRTLQIGFVNHGVTEAFVNGFRLPPVPDASKFLLSSTILWLPVNADENDDTQYQITFGEQEGPNDSKQVFVWYKLKS